MNSCPSIIRINKNQISYTSNLSVFEKSLHEALAEASKEKMKVMIAPLTKKKGLINISLYGITGIQLISQIIQVKPSMWKEIMPVFSVFQEIAMVVGALAIITGLIVMVFKRKIGWTIISTAGLVVLGCYLVPSAVMLVAIIGKLLNGALSNAFETFNQG